MTLDALKQLRARSGASFADCRLALDGAGGDIERAQQILHDLAVSRLQGILNVDAARAEELVSRYGWDFEKARRASVDWKREAAEKRVWAEREAKRPPIDRAREALQDVSSYYDLVDRGILLEAGHAGDGSWPEVRLAEGQETFQWLGVAYLLICTDQAQWFWDDAPDDFDTQKRAIAALERAGWADIAGHLRIVLASPADSIDQESEFGKLVRNVDEDEIFARLKSWALAHADEIPIFTGLPDMT